MTTQSGTIGEREARIEGVLQHLATKADVEALRCGPRSEMRRLRTEMRRLELTFALVQLASMGIILAALRLWM